MDERERWLVTEGFIAGYVAAGGAPLRNERVSDKARVWLEDCVADSVTVEMALEHEADKYAPSLRAEVERLREALKRISEGDVGRPLKAEKCSHGQYGYEHCEECFSDFARGALEGASDD